MYARKKVVGKYVCACAPHTEFYCICLCVFADARELWCHEQTEKNEWKAKQESNQEKKIHSAVLAFQVKTSTKRSARDDTDEAKKNQK